MKKWTGAKITHTRDKKIYISHETKKYIICSFNENGVGKFKLEKTEFYG